MLQNGLRDLLEKMHFIRVLRVNRIAGEETDDRVN